MILRIRGRLNQQLQLRKKKRRKNLKFKCQRARPSNKFSRRCRRKKIANAKNKKKSRGN